jgi:flavoprotein
MAVNKKRASGNGSTVAAKSRASWVQVIRDVLRKTTQIDAVFLSRDDANVVHVYSVARDFQPKIYDQLLKQERVIEKDFPEIAFEFHLRAHQGRQPAQAVPFDAELVFAR